MDSLEKLSSWAHSRVKLQGGTTVVSSTATGLGLQADVTYAKEKEAAAIVVPQDLVLSNSRLLELAQSDPKLKQWLSVGSPKKLDLLHRGLLYLWLEAGETPWRDYLDSLPRDVGLPFSLSVKEMEGLDYASVSLMFPALSRRLAIERAYEKFNKAQPKVNLSLEQWLLPHQWISSRAVTHPKTGETCLVPFIDLANHSSTQHNARYDTDENGDFVLLKVPWPTDAQRPSSGKEDLLLDYGDRSSAEFVYNYGFVPVERTLEDFDEVFRAFDPSVEIYRNVLDPGRSSENLEDAADLSQAYEFLLDFFGDTYPQVLRLVRLPTSIEATEAKRYKFHNNFIMVVASQDHLEVREEDGCSRLFVKDAELTPGNAFEVILKLHDKQIMRNARQLVGQLCRVFQAQLSQVPQEAVVIKALAEREGQLYEHYAKTASIPDTPPL